MSETVDCGYTEKQCGCDEKVRHIDIFHSWGETAYFAPWCPKCQHFCYNRALDSEVKDLEGPLYMYDPEPTEIAEFVSARKGGN